MIYIVHGRYYGSNQKFKVEVDGALSAPGAVSYTMSNLPGVRVALCGVILEKDNE